MNQLETTLKFLKDYIPEVENIELRVDNCKISPDIIIKFEKKSNIPDLVLEYYSFDKRMFMFEVKKTILKYLETVPKCPKMTVMEIVKSDIKKICSCFKRSKPVKRANVTENTSVGFRSKSRIN